MRNALLGALGIAIFLTAWEIVGRLQLLGISWPPLSDVLEMLADTDKLPLFQRALGATLESTLLGYLWGTGAGLALAALAHLAPPLRRTSPARSAGGRRGAS